MNRLLIVAGVVLVASVVAVLVQRRRPEPPTQARWPVPAQLDRGDFDQPDTAWLVAVFSSSTCLSCAATIEKADVLAGAEVVVQNVDVGARPDLHRRYGVDAVPVTVVVDGEGVVRASFVGEPTATDLWAAMAELRGPGPQTPKTPEPGA
jgi:hypothetical protein